MTDQPVNTEANQNGLWATKIFTLWPSTATVRAQNSSANIVTGLDAARFDQAFLHIRPVSAASTNLDIEVQWREGSTQPFETERNTTQSAAVYTVRKEVFRIPSASLSRAPLALPVQGDDLKILMTATPTSALWFVGAHFTRKQ